MDHGVSDPLHQSDRWTTRKGGASGRPQKRSGAFFNIAQLLYTYIEYLFFYTLSISSHSKCIGSSFFTFTSNYKSEFLDLKAQLHQNIYTIHNLTFFPTSGSYIKTCVY